MKGQPVDEFSGYNGLQSKIDGVRDSAFHKVDAEKVTLMAQADSRKGEMIQKINSERPKIEYFDALP